MDQKLKAVIVVHSWHHGNTRKIADSMGKVLIALVRTTDEISPEEIANYALIGLGAGIDKGQHYQALLDFAEGMPMANGQKVFIFSTAGVAGSERKKLSDHKALRDILQAKGYTILDEFSCRGFSTSSFMKVFGGLNKGHPDAQDFLAAELFATGLINQMPL